MYKSIVSLEVKPTMLTFADLKNVYFISGLQFVNCHLSKTLITWLNNQMPVKQGMNK